MAESRSGETDFPLFFAKIQLFLHFFFNFCADRLLCLWGVMSRGDNA